jgi:hypothetical protein
VRLLARIIDHTASVVIGHLLPISAFSFARWLEKPIYILDEAMCALEEQFARSRKRLHVFRAQFARPRKRLSPSRTLVALNTLDSLRPKLMTVCLPPGNVRFTLLCVCLALTSAWPPPSSVWRTLTGV